MPSSTEQNADETKQWSDLFQCKILASLTACHLQLNTAAKQKWARGGFFGGYSKNALLISILPTTHQLV